MSWLLYGLQKNHRRQVVPVTYFLVWHMDSCVDTCCILVWWNPGKVFWMIDLKILFMLSNICMVQKPRIISNGLLKWFGSDNTNMNITATHAKITAVCFSDILFRLTTRQSQNSTLLTLWWQLHPRPWWQVDSLQKGPVMRKTFHCHDIIICL